MYFNVRSLLPKIDNLRSLCVVHSPDIICIVETWLDDTILDSEVSIQGYHYYRLDRSRHGGGVMIFVKNMFTFSLLFKGTLNCVLSCLLLAVLMLALILQLHYFIDLQFWSRTSRLLVFYIM